MRSGRVRHRRVRAGAEGVNDKYFYGRSAQSRNLEGRLRSRYVTLRLDARDWDRDYRLLLNININISGQLLKLHYFSFHTCKYVLTYVYEVAVSSPLRLF